NLLSPGKNPKSNMQFMTFLVNVVKAVNDNQELLRASVMNENNSYRLGGHEAPPAIISVFLGSYLTNILENIASKVKDKKMTPQEKTEIKLGLGKIPEILLDNTDRNRTSPFAFTGNRFEFRAVGSSANCSSAMIVLNAAVTRQLKIFSAEVEAVIQKGRKKDEAIFQVLKKYIIESERIRFEGDGYSHEWHEEAVRRGLSAEMSVPRTLKAYVSASSRKTLVDTGVLTSRELEGRLEVELEKFTKKVQIEARVLGDLAINHIVPIAVGYMTALIDNVRGLRDIFDENDYMRLAGARKELIVSISDHISMIKKLTSDMIDERRKANVIADPFEKALAYETNVKPYLGEIRSHIDRLEIVIDNEMWPLPKYRELLFTR
ncbi:MAG: glutamine synthetase type III, partial [Bacteroidales bacterium]|nr:glutamine synthetase type III [Bacteroidales bacterium]